MDIEILPLLPSQFKVIDSDLGFGNKFTNRMFSQKYTTAKGWFDAKIDAYQPISLDPSAAVFHYAQCIFEGTKAYNTPDNNINLFRIEENMKRFNRSAKRMAMPEVDPDFHLDAILQLLKLEKNWIPTTKGSALYIRPTMIATQHALGVHASSSYLHFVILSPVGSYFKEGFNPISVFISHDYRRAVKGGTGEAKAGGNYAGSLFVSEKAKAKGYSQVLWLDAIKGKYIEEVGAMNICFVYEGKEIVTPPLSGSILPGITRDSIIKLGTHLGYTVSERKIDVNDMLSDIDSGKITEVFGCGTAAVIAPVGKFGYMDETYIINNYEVGPVANHLYQELTGIQRGIRPDPFNWTTTIETSKIGEKPIIQ